LKRRWSLERRLTVWFTVMTVALVGVILTVSTLAMLGATAREFQAVASEEIDELRALFRNRELSREAMHDEAATLAGNHPGVRVGFRIWDQASGEEWGTFGMIQNLPPIGEQPKEPWLRLREVPFGSLQGSDKNGPLWIGMYVDGRGQLFPLKKYGAVAAAMLVGAGLFALLAGALFGRKTARLLESVAQRVQEMEQGGTPGPLANDPPVEIERVADALASALEHARSEQERSTFLIAGVAHELRSPIQNLLGETEVLLMRERSVEEYRHTLDSHSEEIQDLAREIDNLVTLCAHGTNQAHQGRESFDLREELELSIPLEQGRATRRKVSLKTDLRGDLRLNGDREALMLVLRNLIGNAIAFAPEGSEVMVSAHLADENIVLAVDDAGPGVPVELREQIFEPFRMGTKAPNARTGFGLGLALAKEAIGGHGGSLIVVDSDLGGARFEAHIPVRRPMT